MEQVFRIAGMHCGGCVKRVTNALKTIAHEATVTLDPPRAVLTVDAPLALETVRAAVGKSGAYVVEPA